MFSFNWLEHETLPLSPDPIRHYDRHEVGELDRRSTSPPLISSGLTVRLTSPHIAAALSRSPYDPHPQALNDGDAVPIGTSGLSPATISTEGSETTVRRPSVSFGSPSGLPAVQEDNDAPNDAIASPITRQSSDGPSPWAAETTAEIDRVVAAMGPSSATQAAGANGNTNADGSNGDYEGGAPVEEAREVGAGEERSDRGSSDGGRTRPVWRGNPFNKRMKKPVTASAPLTANEHISLIPCEYLKLYHSISFIFETDVV